MLYNNLIANVRTPVTASRQQQAPEKRRLQELQRALSGGHVELRTRHVSGNNLARALFPHTLSVPGKPPIRIWLYRSFATGQLHQVHLRVLTASGVPALQPGPVLCRDYPLEELVKYYQVDIIKGDMSRRTTLVEITDDQAAAMTGANNSVRTMVPKTYKF